MIGYGSPKQVASKLVEENQKLQEKVDRLQAIVDHMMSEGIWEHRAEAVKEFGSYIGNQIELLELTIPHASVSRRDICHYVEEFINNDKKRRIIK